VFVPGKDTKDHTRGISGIYLATAKSTRFPDRQDTEAIEVKVKDLKNLESFGAGGNFFIQPTADFTRHGLGVWGTQRTLNVIQQLADDVVGMQVLHNQELQLLGKKEWPFVLLRVSHISLSGGGLFDRTPTPWQPPYKAHRYGEAISFYGGHIRSAFTPALQDEAFKWLKGVTLTLGKKYGSWQSDGEGVRSQLIVTQTYASASGAPAGTLVDSPDLSVVAFLSDPAERWGAAAGQTVSYTVGLDNYYGGAQAQHVTLTATLPAGLTFVRAVPAATRMGGANRPVWELGTLAAQELPRIFDVVARIDSGVPPGTVLTATAQASTSDADAMPENNQFQAFGLLVQPPGPDLAVQSDLDAAAMTVGQPVTFTMEVANAGNALAAGAAVTLTLPASVTLVSAVPMTSTSSAGHATWNLGNLAPDASRRITVTLALDPALAAMAPFDPNLETGGVLTYTLRAGSATPDIDLSNNMEQVVKGVEFAGPDLTVWLGVQGADDVGTLTVGQDVTYTILYGNFGNRIAPTTTVTLSLWSGLSLVSAQPAPSRTMTSTTFAGGVLGWDLGALEVGESGSIQARAHVASVPAEGSLVLATIGNAHLDIYPANNVDLLIRSQFVQSPQRLFLPLVQR
jgi:uncharacterized repeat protein (TIGR01451 family)